jgi:SPP1 family predicted phage head-tail adaptor
MPAYTKKIQIQTCTSSYDKYGNESGEWTTILTPWANAVCTTGKEYYQAAQVNAENDMTFKIRYSKRIHQLHTSEVRIVYKGRTYNVKQITDYREQHKELVIRAAEINGEG